ncbi:hypothetical protein ABL78_1243 [Leptomonas seymouri]|uniref:Membrane-associated protein n=1 Tax=Leptomonas seymouri TaxID=5684 RepID=A0A0N1PG18_LEPSE|nr:hypothetical protein ABL78_1243 [Leptomonas seymouri]|eukprot:KPI89662.1 hypothetical protein ABL78_1243 [Leptomonas seymouri]
MRGGSNRRMQGAPPRSQIALLNLVLLLFLCEAAHIAHGFAFVPITASFAVPDPSASRSQARLLCLNSGGHVAGEPTATLHQSVINTVRAAGAGEIWHAFLGADTKANQRLNCPLPITEASTINGVSYGCYWRWNEGRWTATGDDTTLPLSIYAVGVTFFIGNIWRKPSSSTITLYGPTGGFPTFFDRTNEVEGNRRPGMLFGQDLITSGVSNTATWSDNLASGGSSYAGYTYNNIAGASEWNETAQLDSKAFFWAVCQIQAPTRAMYEASDTSSALQQRWWCIFFIILFIVMLVAFIVVACCQEDEEMDEPPEDAPDWAQQETQETKRTKSFVSTRSFHGNNYDAEEADDCSSRQHGDNAGDAYYDNASSAGDNVSSNNYGNDFQGYACDEGMGYSNQAPPQQDPWMMQMPHVTGSQRHLGRQNGSGYNAPQPMSGQFKQFGYVDS